MSVGFQTINTLLPQIMQDAIHNVEIPGAPSDFLFDAISRQMVKATRGGRRSGVALSPTEAAPYTYVHEYIIKVSDGGLVTGGGFAGNDVVGYGADSNLYYETSMTQLYPDPFKTPLPVYKRIQVALSRARIQVVTTKQQYDAVQLGSATEQVITDSIMDPVKRLRRMWTANMYGDGGAALFRANGAQTVSATAATAAATPIAIKEGTMFRVQAGDRLVAASYVLPANFGSSGRTPRAGLLNSPGVMRVISGKGNSRDLFLQAEQGEGDIAITDGDVFMRHGTYDFTQSTVSAASLTFPGIEGLIISTGNFPGVVGVDGSVTKNHELAGVVAGDDAALETPSNEMLTPIIDKIMDCGWNTPPILIAERSIWTHWSQQEFNATGQRTLPAGATYVGGGGVAGPVFTHGETTYQRVPSTMIRQGMIAGIDPADFMAFVPRGTDTVWVTRSGGDGGTPATFEAVHSGSRLSEVFQANGDAYLGIGLFVPSKQFRRIGVENQRRAIGEDE